MLKSLPIYYRTRTTKAIYDIILVTLIYMYIYINICKHKIRTIEFNYISHILNHETLLFQNIEFLRSGEVQIWDFNDLS